MNPIFILKCNVLLKYLYLLNNPSKAYIKKKLLIVPWSIAKQIVEKK